MLPLSAPRGVPMPFSRAPLFAAPLLVCTLTGIASPAVAGEGPRMLRVAEASFKGPGEPAAFLAAVKVREPSLTACLKSPEALTKVTELQAFLQVGQDGLVRAASVQGAGLPDASVDACLLAELSRTRFPEGPKAIDLVLFLRPDGSAAEGEALESKEKKRK